uniref:Uncharacterized protein n=1 Tax=Arundo donax TaxID=35708 RepID=A0A0A9F912_ARUDO
MPCNFSNHIVCSIPIINKSLNRIILKRQNSCNVKYSSNQCKYL